MSAAAAPIAKTPKDKSSKGLLSAEDTVGEVKPAAKVNPPSAQVSKLTVLKMVADTTALESLFETDLSTLVEQISYDGMDPKFIRKETLRMTGGDPKVLIKWLTMYVHWGSKFYQREKKAKNEKEAQVAIAALKKAGIVENKRDGKVTLARLAAAHAPLLYAVRKYLVAKEICPSSNIVVDGMPLEAHDLAFACYSNYPGRVGIMFKEFLEKFAIVLHKAAVKDKRSGPKTDDEVREEMEKYRLAAAGSLEMDTLNRIDFINVNINTMLNAYGYATI